MANTSAVFQQAACTTYHLLAAQQEPHKKAYLLTKTTEQCTVELEPFQEKFPLLRNSA